MIATEREDARVELAVLRQTGALKGAEAALREDQLVRGFELAQGHLVVGGHHCYVGALNIGAGYRLLLQLTNVTTVDHIEVVGNA